MGSTRDAVAVLAVGLFGLGGSSCNDPKTFDATIEIVQVQRFGSEAKGTSVMDLELRYPDCPGEARRVIRTDKKFAECIGKPKAGDKLPAKIRSAWSSERGAWRSEVTKIGDCDLKVDPKEEANYETVQVCTDIASTGATVGVHCDRTRPKELIAKCPWLRRN